MANSLNIDLTGQVVILRQSYFKAGLAATDHPFRVDGGFGAKPDTIGAAIFGEFLSDGEQGGARGADVERLATSSEVARFTS